MKRVLDPPAYWKLRARCADAQRATAVALQARDAMAVAQKAQGDALTELGIDPKIASFTLDDETTTIDIPD